jgi:hypothetical protein
MVAIQVPNIDISMPRKNVDSINIFMLIQDILSKQKENNKKYGKFSILAVVETLNLQYQKFLDEWAEKSKEMKEVMAKDFQNLKDSFNSTGGWFLGITIAVGIIAGVLTGGLGGLAVGGAVAGISAGGGILGDKVGSGKKIFFDKEKEIDQLKFQKREDEIKILSNDSKHAQDKANVKQGEVSRTMQTDMEVQAQLEVAISNVIVAMLKLFARVADMMGRS